jgi:Fe-S cluster assembly ATPase SufC
MTHVLKIENLHVNVGDKPILRGVNQEMIAEEAAV